MMGIPAILMISGTLLMLGYFFIDRTTHPSWFQFTTSLGSAIVVGGSFSAVLKSLQFSKYFESALSEIVYAERFVGTRRDLQEIWRRITNHVNNQRFPEISGDFNKIIEEDFFPARRDYYIGSIKKTCVIQWSDKLNRMITVSETVDIEIIPNDPLNGCHYEPSYIASIENACNIKALTVDGIDINAPEFEHRVERIRKGQNFITKQTIRLKGKERFNIHRAEEKTIDLRKRPYIKVSPPTFTKGQTVTVICNAQGLQVRFMSLGADEWFTDNVHDTESGVGGMSFSKTQTRLLLPKQGYCLIFVEA